MNIEPKRSGFEDDPFYVKPCVASEHNPPMHMVIPQGKIYRHICPVCGAENIMRPTPIVMWEMTC